MGKHRISSLRISLAIIFCWAGVLLAIFSFASFKEESTAKTGPRLAALKIDLKQRMPLGRRSPTKGAFDRPIVNVPLPAGAPTFGHPIIAGIGGTGFEESIRVDPTNPNRIYTSAPGSLSSDTSWIWHSLDGGKTFRWVVGATPLEGKVTTCFGGGDSETGVDSAGHLYFADLTLANFSTSRSDDHGATFTCSNTGVPDAVVDRQWYTFDGDPTNGGSIYLSNDEFAQAPASCGSATNFGQNVLVMYRS